MSYGPKKPRAQDRTNTFAAVRVDKSAMWPFAKLLWTLVVLLWYTGDVTVVAHLAVTFVVGHVWFIIVVIVGAGEVDERNVDSLTVVDPH